MAQEPSNLPPPPPPMGGGERPAQEPAPPATQQPPTQPSVNTQRVQEPTNDISTEEYVEAIIEERWQYIEEDIRKIVEWKNRSEQRITILSQQFEDVKDRFDKLHAALIGKIEDYDKNILEVGAEIKAMEKVFSKVLPTFTDNVKQLDEITKRLS